MLRLAKSLIVLLLLFSQLQIYCGQMPAIAGGSKAQKKTVQLAIDNKKQQLVPAGKNHLDKYHLDKHHSDKYHPHKQQVDKPSPDKHHSDKYYLRKHQSDRHHPSKHRWQLKDADINDVIVQVAKLTGKNFIIDSRVKGRVSIVTEQPLDQKEIYQVFLAALHTLGFAAVVNDKFIKIVPNNSQSTVGRLEAMGKNSGDEIQTVQVVPINHATANQVVSVIRPLLPRLAHVSAYLPANTLILSGDRATLKRMQQIITQIDQAASTKSDLIALRYANAAQVATLLNGMAHKGTLLGASKAVLADIRTNSILLTGDKLQRMRMRALVAELDQKPTQQSAHTRIIKLHYLNAKTIAPVLNRIALAEQKRLMPSKLADKTIYVEAEENTNALVITANQTITHDLEQIINRLDVRPAQVLVQALIVELNESDANKFGVEWSINDPGQTIDARGFQPGIGILHKGRFSALVAAIRSLDGANILSTPTVVVMNNKKATFNVGKQVSIQSTQSGPLAAVSNNTLLTTSTFKQQDVGLRLDVKPQINGEDAVLLTIEQHDGSLQNPDNPTTTPIINKSDISTTVMINNHDTLVLGGLISNNLTKTINKAPLLGDIPLLGELFTYRNKRIERKKLMVFIHPVILHNALEGTRVTEKHYRYIRQLQIKMQNPWYKMQEDGGEQVLPPAAKTIKLPEPF